jgi:ubiquinone/menaquinone biosynthesis C-methylase UbiE
MDKSNAPLIDLTRQAMDLQDGQRVLEIGFASGRFLHKLFLNRPNLQVTGVDYSPEMVSLAGTLNTELVASGSLTLREASSSHLPFPDETFDTVYSNMVIYFWDQPAQHLREVRRVLKPAGKFYTGFRPTKTMQAFPIVKFGFTLYEPGEWQALLEQNGFRVLRIDTQTDPELEMNGQKFQFESVCMVAQKQPGEVG